MTTRRLPKRLPRPPLADGLLAAGLVGLVLGLELAPEPDPRTPTAALAVGLLRMLTVPGGSLPALVLVLVQVAPVAWRRRYPLPALAVVTAACIAYGAVAVTGEGPFQVGIHPVAVASMLLLIYSVAAYREPRQAALAVALSLAAGLASVVVLSLAGRPTLFEADDLWGSLLGVVAGWGLGASVRQQRARLAARLAAEREWQARRAVTDERARIARELHDVVAHHLSSIVVQAGAAHRVLDEQPEYAREALALIQSTGSQTLAAMRRLLEMLRASDEATDALVPQPSLAHVEQLVAAFRQVGLPVKLRVAGRPRTIPPDVDLSAYRIVEEALTNTLKHAGPVRAEVTVLYGEYDLEVRVDDEGPGGRAPLAETRPVAGGAGPRHGLVGIRERVALFGGQLHVGPRPGGGWSVQASFPVEEARPWAPVS